MNGTGFRHATDRYDWTLVAECPNNGEPSSRPVSDADANRDADADTDAGARVEDNDTTGPEADASGERESADGDRDRLGADPGDATHLEIEASVTNSEYRALEAIPVMESECPLCGADLSVVVEEHPTEVLD